jgi:RNA polymerase sigma-70 factor, ECF subfamily
MATPLERFIDEYSDKAFQFAYQLSGDAEDSKELVQEALFRVIKNWDKYDPSQSLEGWFYTILKNVYTDGIKCYETQKGLSLDWVPEGDEAPFSESLPGDDEQALALLEREETAVLVQKAMRTLPREQRAALALFDIQGVSYPGIAEILDCPLNTVRSRIARARAALREKVLELAGQEAAYAL